MPTLTETRWEYLVAPLQEAKGLKKSDEPWLPDRLRAQTVGRRWASR